MDDTRLIFFTGPMTAVTKLNDQTMRAHTETGHHNVSGWDVRTPQKSCTMPVPQVKSFLGHVADDPKTFRLAHVLLTQTNFVHVQNLYFNEFGTGTLTPPMHFTYLTASAAICNTVMFSPIDTLTLFVSVLMNS